MERNYHSMYGLLKTTSFQRGQFAKGGENNFRVEKDKHYLEPDDQGQYEQ